MIAPESDLTVTGVCHAQGVNKNLPPQWLLYFTVKNLDKCIEECTSNGGKIIAEAKDMGNYGRYCVRRSSRCCLCAF